MRKNASPTTSRWQLLSMLLLSSFALLSCANLQAVREFAKTSAATADYQQVVNDYVNSPGRMRLYQPKDKWPALAQDSAQRKAQQPTLEGVQKVLVEYMSALGDMAADDLPNVDKEVTGISKALTAAKLVGDEASVSQQTANAASSLANVLIRVSMNHWRQRHVRKLVIETDTSVQVVVAGLRAVVEKGFGASLAVEQASTDNFFRTVGMYGSDNPGAVPQLARVMRREHLDMVEARRRKQLAYVEVLNKIGQGHRALRKNIKHLKKKQVKTLLLQYAKDLKTLYKAYTELQS